MFFFPYAPRAEARLGLSPPFENVFQRSGLDFGKNSASLPNRRAEKRAFWRRIIAVKLSTPR